MSQPNEPAAQDRTPHEQWTAVDAFFDEALVRPSEDFAAIRRAAAEAEMPAIEVSAAQGKFLALMVQITGARRILEVGTLAGFSTLWLARAAGPDGKIITCEFEPKHAEVARRNLEAAGVGERVEIKVGPAADSLQSLLDVGGADEPFDLVFLDADKVNNPVYLEFALKMSRKGTVIIGDNVVRGGGVLDSVSEDPDIQGTRRFLQAQGENPALEATALQTVGMKGWDGFSLALVK